MIVFAKTLTILVAAASMLLVGLRHREWRGGFLLLSCVFFAAGMNEFEWLFGPAFPMMNEPEIPAIAFFLILGAILAFRNHGTTLTVIRAICKNRRFPLLVWGLLLVSLLPQLGTDRHVWNLLVPAKFITGESRELVEHGIEFLGYVFLLNWSLLFLKDKRRILVRHMPSPHEHLLYEQPWERVGWGGSRRNCYRLGDSGFCVKFYKPQTDCEPGKMKRSIRRDIGWRRFNKFRNSCSQEVLVYESLRHDLSMAFRACLPGVCERVYHPEYGWGALETYYTNPDGEAIIPYEFEIARQSPENRELIYAQAKDLLDELIASGARFYEPGNFHVLVGADGSVSLRIVDFEPESKMLIPLETVWPWYRRRKLARKAERYLRQIRERYGVRGKTGEWLAAERGFGTGFVSFEELSVGNMSRNFKAVTEDGDAYFVKFGRTDALNKAQLVDRTVDCPLIGKMAFGGRSFRFGEQACFAYRWIEGAASIQPQDMTRVQIRGLGEAYVRMSAALASLGAGMLHGGLHYDNVFYRGDEVVAFFDFEMMRQGLPTEDLLRVFAHRLERTRFWKVGTIRRIYSAFCELVRVCPYSTADWLEAIDRTERSKREARLRKRKWRAVVVLENGLRSWQYRVLRRCVR